MYTLNTLYGQLAEDSCRGVAACIAASDGMYVKAHSCNGDQTVSRHMCGEYLTTSHALD